MMKVSPLLQPFPHKAEENEDKSLVGIAVVYPDRQFFPRLRILREPGRVVLLIVRRIAECRNRTIGAAKRRTVRADRAENLRMRERVRQRALSTCR